VSSRKVMFIEPGLAAGNCTPIRGDSEPVAEGILGPVPAGHG
jgi:hypothetical protein